MKFLLLFIVAILIHSCTKQPVPPPRKISISINNHLDGVISVSEPLENSIEVVITFKLCFSGGSLRYETKSYIIKQNETFGRYDILPNVCSGKIISVSCSNESYFFTY